MIEALKRLGTGRHDMATVAAEIGEGITPMEARRVARALGGVQLDGRPVRLERVRGKVWVSWHDIVPVADVLEIDAQTRSAWLRFGEEILLA